MPEFLKGKKGATIAVVIAALAAFLAGDQELARTLFGLASENGEIE